MEKKVAIIGAGISGLLACKYTLSKGFHPIVFESQSSVGGVWTKTLETTKLQTPKPVYQFSDFPWPSSVSELFPCQHQVFDYIHGYAKHFDLIKHVKFNTKVSGIEFEGPDDEEIGAWGLWGGNGEPFGSKGKWNVLVEDLETLSSEVYKVDFVIVCVGRFSGLPHIPEFPRNKGPEVFHGEVIHSSEYAAMDDEQAARFIKGKRIVVVGFQKSALDIAMECSAANGVENPCTMLCRTPHWNVSDYLPWGFLLAHMYFSRVSELMVHKPGEGLLLGLLATVLAPLRYAYSKIDESHIKRKHRLVEHDMVPPHSFLNEISSCLISTVPEKFYDKVEEGEIKLKRSPSFSFCNDGVLVDGDTSPIEAGIINETLLRLTPRFSMRLPMNTPLATGFKSETKLTNIFTSQTVQDYINGSPHAALPLYRECIQPRIPQLAVIGFSENISNMFTSEIRCRWVVELLDGTFKLPSIKEMEKDIEQWDKYLKRYSGKYYRRKCIGALQIWYNDQLCKDMGLNPRRKNGFFAEFFEPYGPSDYVSD